MFNWIVSIMEQYGYIGVFLMMMLENLFPPIPSEVILPFGGYLTTTSNVKLTGVIIVATTGSLAGAMLLYGVGALVGSERIEMFVERWGYLFRIKQKDLYRADKWFQQYGYWTVLLCRMVPLLRSLISIPAGMYRMRLSLFVIMTIIGSIIWNSILILSGVFLGRSWERVVQFMDLYSAFIYVMIGCGLILWFAKIFFGIVRYEK